MPKSPRPQLKTLFSGDRAWTDWVAVLDTMNKYNPSLVIEGEAKGLDRMAGVCADALGITCVRMPAGWGRYGRGAGPIRNTAMLRRLILSSETLDNSDILVICFHDDLSSSRGTRNMAKQARKLGVGVKLVRHRR